MEIAKYISDGTTRTYAPPCTFKAALNLGVYVNNSYIDRNDYELIRGQVLFKSTAVPTTGTIVEIRVDNTVSDISTASLDDLNICANNIANINSVANRIDDVLALAPSMASIEIVADNIANITEIHTTIIPNITEILNADTNAGIATTQATNATNQASNALTSANTAIDRATVATAAASNALSYKDSASASATTATNKATEASTYASNASTSATLAQGYANDASTSKNTTQGYMTTTEGYKNTTQGYMNNASTSATNASNSATNAASTLSNFNSKYTSSATAPASPTEGMLWYDTATNIMKVYDGSGWINAGSSVNGTSSRNTYTATAGQTTFSATYDSGYVDVYRNGLKLSNSDFVATNGTTIALNNACSLNDVVDIVAYGTFELADSYTKNDSDALFNTKVDKVASTDNAIVRFNGTSGQVQNSSVIVDDSGNLLLNSGTGGLGYGTGSGGTVTQLTSKSTSVTLNKPTGKIITASDSLGAGVEVYFILNNSLIQAGDGVIVTNTSIGAYSLRAGIVLDGRAFIYIKNTSGVSDSQSIPIIFQVIKGAIS